MKLSSEATSKFFWILNSLDRYFLAALSRGKPEAGPSGPEPYNMIGISRSMEKK
jgi:hypothetical protein